MSDQAERKPLPAIQSGAPIRAIVPGDFDAAWRIGNAVCVAGMAPKDLATAERATIAIMHGLEVGLPPMAALQSIAVINGRPTIWGDGALGLVQGSGKMQTIKETIEGAGDNRVAICRVVRRDDPEPKIGRFSVADAKTAGLWGKKGPWQEYPGRMLQMRARAFALRDGFADVLRGLGIAEEQRDVIEHDPAETPAPPAPPKKSALGVEKPVSSVQRMPPTPPTPPVKTSKPAPEIIDDDNIEVAEQARVEDVAEDLLSQLDDALENATTPEAVQEIWDEHDLMSVYENNMDAERLQGMALALKRKHVKRVS